MSSTQNKSVNKQPFKLPLTAIVLGLFSVAAALVISFVAYKYALETTEKHYQQFYLNKAKTFAADIRDHKDYPDKKMLKAVNSLWQNLEKRAPDEYLCVVDKNSKLIFCSLHPDTANSYPGNNAIISDSQHPDCTLIDIVKSKMDYVGTYISSKGQEQIAAFVHIPDRQWILGVNRLKTAMLGEVKSNVRPFFIGLIIVCGLLMPASLFLMYHTFHLSQQRRRSIEKILHESEEKYRLIFETAATLITSVNAQGVIVDCNHRVKETLGYERQEIIGQTMGKIIHPDYLPKAQKALNKILTKGFLYNHDYKMVRKDGKFIDVTMNSSAIKGEDDQYERTICIITDITERVQAEQLARKHQEELAHVSRLSTIGEMASGLAHELNQPLSAILSYANACSRLIKVDSPDIEKVKNSLEIIAAQTIRSGEIIHRIKNFVRKTEPRRTDININDIVKDVSDFIDADIRRNKIVLKLDLAKQMPMVLADSIQIEQVLLNLALNSIEALADEQTRKRQLTIKTSTHNGDTIEVEVCDSGKGLDLEIKQKIFDSFFSTKPEGLGIGLSISRSIIESHKGQIWATESLDGGTKLKFTLSIAHAAATL